MSGSSAGQARNRPGASGVTPLARVAWAAWNALLVLVTSGLLAVALYAARATPADGPSAMPVLMAGLLSLCVIVLALISAVNAALWAHAAGVGWWWTPVLVAAAIAGAAMIFALAASASDPGGSALERGATLAIFVLAVLAAHVVNRRAVSRYRGQRSRPFGS